MSDLQEKFEVYGTLVKSFYDRVVEPWSLENRDPLVGSFDAHNAHGDYDEYLFKNVETGGVALDFACGVGRNIVKFWDRFEAIDGVDISPRALEKAHEWIVANKGESYDQSFLVETNGYDLQNFGPAIYNVIFSTIAFQHIGVYEVRRNFLKEFFRILQPGGVLTIQMGFGKKPGCAGYYSNNWEQPLQDTMVESEEYLALDLSEAGFRNFEYDIRPVGPGDNHANWIFFRARKP